MKKQELRKLIRSSVRSVLKESFLAERKDDPTREDMLHYLQQQFGREEGFEDSAEVAMYWFANHYHGGQWSNLYSVLSTSPFRPGPISRGPEPDSMEDMMYQALEAEFGGKQTGDESELQEGTPQTITYLDNNFYILSPHQARLFSIDGQLPRSGYEKKADMSKLQGVMVNSKGRNKPLELSNTDEGWILPTQHGNDTVWAIRIHRKSSIPEMTGTSAVAGYASPYAFDKKGIKEVDWHDEESYKHSHGDAKIDPGEEESYGKYGEEKDPLYVEYVGQMTGEKPFMMGDKKFEYVWAKYPNGKKDIGVYAFAGDVVYSYNAFREMYNIKETAQPEPYDPETDQFAPGPRQRPEDWQQNGAAERKPIPQKVDKAKVKRALDAVGLMKNHEWRPLLDRARKAYHLFPDDGNDPQKLNLVLALQYMDEHPEL